jgi:hypothetical protein
LQAVACDHRITACVDSRGVDQYHVRTIGAESRAIERGK